MCTKNNDPETLKKILLKRDNGVSFDNGGQSENPMIAASLANHLQCMQLLYKAGYRIRLADEDATAVSISMEEVPETRVEDTDQDPAQDPVVRFLHFKAFSNPLYLSIDLAQGDTLAAEDPIKRANALGQRAKLLAEHFPEHSVEYLKMQEQLKTYVKDLLSQCSNSQEIEVLLKYSPRAQGRQDPLFIWALSWEQKLFVAHPYYQQFLRESLQAGGYSSTSSFIEKFFSILTVLLLFLTYPLVILADSIFREGTILFESPDVFKETMNTQRPEDVECECIPRTSERPESRFWHFFRKRMHCPSYRIWIHAFWEMFFICILYISLSKPRRQNDDCERRSGANSEQIFADYLLYAMVLHYLINDVVEIVRRTRIFFSSFWNVYTLMANVVLFSGGFMTRTFHKLNDEAGTTNCRAELPGGDPLNIAVTLIAFGAILYGLRTARWFLLHHRVGPVIICFIRVLKDVIYVFLVWVVVYMSFALGIWLLYKPFEALGECETEYCMEEKLVLDNRTMMGVATKMFWIVFDGDGSDQRIQHKSALNTTEVFSKEFSHPTGLGLWAMYQGIVVILLLNILIAMMV